MRLRIGFMLLCLLLVLPPVAAEAQGQSSPVMPLQSQGPDDVFVTDDVPLLSMQDTASWNGTGLPAWTYEMYCVPFMRFSYYSRADPVNLIFEMSYSAVRANLRRYGWRETSRWNILEANINYLPYSGFMRPQSANFFLDSYNGTRYHLRLWDMGGKVVGQAHIDTSIPHKAYAYESAESQVARVFWRYSVERNSCPLHNACYDDKGYYCNGWATVIKYK